MDKDKKAVFNIRVNGLYCKEYKLGDILTDLKTGKCISKDKLNDLPEQKNNIPYYGANGIIGYTNTYLYNGEYVLTARNGTLGTIFISKNKFYPSDHTFVLFHDIKKINVNYLGFYLKYCIDFKKLNKHNGIPGINKDIINNIIINIPSLQEQEKIIKEIEQIESTQSTYTEYGKMIQSQIESINKVIDNLTKLNKENEEDTNNTDNSSESEEERPIKKVIKSKIKQIELTSESDSSSESEELKPKKVIKSKQTKKQESSSESDSSSESEEERPKKVIKSKIKQIELTSESE